MPRVSTIVALVALWPSAASAQIVHPLSFQALNAVRFDTTELTSRTMALAGTGIGMPDDATAAITNPAGLRLLVRGEVVGSVCFAQAAVPMIVRGAITTNPSGTVVATQFDTENQGSLHGGWFGAVAYPTAGRVTIAGYGQIWNGSNPVIRPLTASPAGAGVTQLLPTNSGFTSGNGIGFLRFGGAASVSLPGNTAIGLAVEPRWSIEFPEILLVARTVTLPAQGIFAAQPVDQLLMVPGDAVPGVGYRLGFSWGPTSRVNVGAVYDHGSTHALPFQIRQDIFRDGENPIKLESTARLRFPDAIGFGIGVRLTETARLMLDAKRIRYSQAQAFFADLLQTVPLPASSVIMRDGTEFRFATEHVFPFTNRAIVLRGGVWRSPAHSPVYTGDDALFRGVFSERIGGQVHGTFGGGIVKGRLELSAGADFAGERPSAIVSAAVRFR